MPYNVVDFLLVLIELFSAEALRAIICSKSAILRNGYSYLLTVSLQYSPKPLGWWVGTVSPFFKALLPFSDL